jgi:hypothetical protein
MITRLGTYSEIKGSSIKIPCVVATTGAITLSGTQTIDGIAVIVGDRVLVNNQGTASTNGIYVVSASTWSRAIDMSLDDDVYTGLQIYITSGTANGGKFFALTTANPITLDTTSLSFAISAAPSSSISGTLNYVAKFTGSGTTIGNSNLINDASGNLGLGVTPSPWGSLYKAIQISAGASFYGINSDSRYAVMGANTYNNNTNDIYIGSGAASLYVQGIGAHQWFTATSGTAGNAISFTQAMTLTASGNLGIGTTSPTFQLDVLGSIPLRVVSNSNASSATYGASQIFRQSNTIGNGVGIALGMWNSSNSNTETAYIGTIITTNTLGAERGDLVFYTTNNGSARNEGFRLNSSGNVLIGTTTDAGYKLDVNGTGRFSDALDVTGIITANANVSGQSALILNRTTNTNNGYLMWKTGATYDWLLSQSPLAAATSDLTLYSYGTSSIVLTIARATGAATFSNTIGINGVADNIKSGTYTPTAGDFTNISSATVYTAQYTRVGNVVTVSGKVEPVTTTASTLSYFTLSLPTTMPNFNAEEQAAGSGMIKNNVTNDVNAVVYAGVGSTKVQFQFTPLVLAGSRPIFYQFTYLIR